MKVGMMQPYFFPYVGYFSLIKNTDRWIVCDQVQFMRHGWIERNRVLKSGEGWQYVSVPLKKHSHKTSIKDIEIRTEEDWKRKIIRQLELYKKAPYYARTVELIRESWNIETDSIVELNVRALKTICDYLSVSFRYDIFTEMNLEIAPVNRAGDWAVNIGKSLKISEYMNPIGGKDLYQSERFKDAGIKLVFLKNNLPPYNQRRERFEAGLSIIDALMFNDAEQINAMLDDVEYIYPV